MAWNEPKKDQASSNYAQAVFQIPLIRVARKFSGRTVGCLSDHAWTKLGY